jgi:hypothetical protein
MTLPAFANAIPITHADVWITIILILLVTLAVKACRFTWPDAATVQSYATITNTPGGLILILTILWVFTLANLEAFCIWTLVKGIDPQNGTVILLQGMLSTGAFGAVSGALFSQMKGQEPSHPPKPPTEPPPGPGPQ